MEALRLVLRHACGMSPAMTSQYMPMPARYAANARIVRVVRIITNQIHRLGAYLRLPHSVNRNPQDWTTQWHLMHQYNRVTEGS